jgi:hypothetical protein
VSNYCPVYLDAIVVIEIQELRPSELDVVVLDKAHCLFGGNFVHGLSLDLLSEHVNHDKQVAEAPGCFLEGSQEVQAPHGKGPCDEGCFGALGLARGPVLYSIGTPCKTS